MGARELKTAEAVTMVRRQPRMKRVAATVAVLVALAPSVAAAASWRVEQPPAPSGATQAELYAVSCPTVSDCVTVGGAASGATSVASPFVDTESSAMWAPSPLTLPKPDAADLASVSCPTTTFCVAAGSSHGGTDGAIGVGEPSGEPLVETWNGTSWSATPLPLSHGLSGGFQGVSCSSTHLCLAVGSARRNGRDLVPVAASFQGRGWRATTPLGEGKLGSTLDGVSCIAGQCTAVGGYSFELGPETPSGGPMVERWAGGRWTRETAPQYISRTATHSPPSKWATELTSVSCTSPVSCLAVGTADPPGNGAPEAFGEVSSGHRWHINSIGLPHLTTAGHTVTFAELTGVDCASADVCLAVGETYPSTEHHVNTLLAARWNGHAFTREAGLGTTAQGGLNGVSCPTASSCAVVGGRSRDGGSSTVPLAEVEGSAGVATAWRHQAPLPAMPASRLMWSGA
jgi:hypothetical protein